MNAKGSSNNLRGRDMPLEIGDVALLLFIGVGPVKSFVPFLAATSDMSRSDQMKTAGRIVGVVAILSVMLLALGQALEHLFHFSEPSLVIAGGLILGVLGVRMVLAELGGTEESRHDLEVWVPLAIPFTLNPIGIAGLIVLSGTTAELMEATPVLLVLVGMLLLDFVVFVIGSAFPAPSPKAVAVVEIIFGVLVVALAVDVVGLGLGDLATERLE